MADNAHHYMTSIPEKTGAAASSLAKRLDGIATTPGSGRVADAECPPPPTEARGRRAIRLGGSGVLVGYVHEDVPERPGSPSNSCRGELRALLVPLSDSTGVVEVIDQNVRPTKRGYRPRLVAVGDHCGLPSL